MEYGGRYYILMTDVDDLFNEFEVNLFGKYENWLEMKRKLESRCPSSCRLDAATTDYCAYHNTPSAYSKLSVLSIGNEGETSLVEEGDSAVSELVMDVSGKEVGAESSLGVKTGWRMGGKSEYVRLMTREPPGV